MPFAAAGIGSILAGAATTAAVGWGLNQLTGGNTPSQNPNNVSGPGSAAQTADPFASQRPQYQQQLQQLMQNPNSVTNTPGYNFQMQQGTDAVARQQAAMGGAGSGAEQAALTQYGQGLASNQYQQQFNNLSTLSGANVGSPGAAGQLQQQQNQQNQQSIGQFTNTLGAAAGPAISNWLNPASTGNTTDYGSQTASNPQWAMG